MADMIHPDIMAHQWLTWTSVWLVWNEIYQPWLIIEGEHMYTTVPNIFSGI